MKILKSRKALSPVVASIILIAVTVAVSIAVAAWMGALTFTFTAVEELQMPTSSEVTFYGTAAENKYVNLTVRNTGTSKVSIVDVRINQKSVKSDVVYPSNFNSSGVSIDPASSQSFQIKLNWSAGYKYRIEFVTSSNKIFYQDYTAPS
ncbi:MAG: archaellin/type IV pilin N-terminal domain-containing protein [Candidatus Bathycorpusculaceae bacterium]